MRGLKPTHHLLSVTVVVIVVVVVLFVVVQISVSWGRKVVGGVLDCSAHHLGGSVKWDCQ